MHALWLGLVLGSTQAPPPEERCQAVLALLHDQVACRELPQPGTTTSVRTTLDGKRFLRAGEVCADASFVIESTSPAAALDLRLFATASAKTLRFQLFTLPTKTSSGLGASGGEFWKSERGWVSSRPCRAE